MSKRRGSVGLAVAKVASASAPQANALTPGGRLRATSALLCGLTLLAACTPNSGTSGPAALPSAAGASPSQATATTAASVGPTSIVGPTAPPQQAPLTWSKKKFSGTRSGVRFKFEVPFFFGGPEAAEINRRISASVQTAVNNAAVSAGDSVTASTPADLAGPIAVTTNDGRTVQVEIDWAAYVQGDAHPTDGVETVVLTVAHVRPVTLKEIFRSETAAFTALAPVIKRLAEVEGQPVNEPTGLTPEEKNWAAWQSSAAGMTFSFQDYQLGGHGVRQYTVPWPVLERLLTPAAYSLLGPIA